MLLKIIIVLLLIFILYSLASGLVYLLKDRGQTDRVVKALTWRVGLSLAAFILIMGAASLGWITPQVV